MRASTPSFVVSVKVHLPKQIENHLEKSFNITNSAYNEALGLGLRRIKAMRANPRYQEFLETHRSLAESIKRLKKSKGLSWQLKLYDKALYKLRLDYGLSEFSLSKHLTNRRNEPNSPYQHLSSSELQVIAKDVYQTLEKVIFYKIKPDRVKFRSKFNSTASFRNQVNSAGTRIVPSGKTGVAYTLFIHKKSTFVDISAKAFNEYQQMSLLRAEKIKYVQIVRKTIRGKRMYYLQIVCEGYPLAKVTKGENTVGIDPGVSTVAYASKNSVELVDLVPENITSREKLIKSLDRRIERSRRVNNPDSYHSNGKIKRGVRFKRPTNRAERLIRRRQKVYRSLTEERLKLQGELVNRIVSEASIIRMEELNVNGLQKRSKDIRINPKTNRPYSKKRFGKAILKVAPSYFREALKTRANALGISFEIINPQKVKPSQYNHLTQSFEKKTLSTRMFDLSDKWTGVQRDLYSAFLIGHIENGQYDQTISKEFPNFYQKMKEFLAKQKPSRLDWYLK